MSPKGWSTGPTTSTWSERGRPRRSGSRARFGSGHELRGTAELLCRLGVILITGWNQTAETSTVRAASCSWSPSSPFEGSPPAAASGRRVYTAAVCGILARSSASLIVSLRPTSVAWATS